MRHWDVSVMSASRQYPTRSGGWWAVRLPAIFVAGAALLSLLSSGCGTAGAVPTPDTPPVAVVPAPLGDADWADDILYFVIVDRFADGDSTNNQSVDRKAKGAFHGGDLAGVRQQLTDLADLGVTAIWITPVVRNISGFVTGAGFPDWGYHGYWADDFYSLDPRFGSEDELRALVDAAHKRGIKVLLDVVYNHAGYNSRYVTDPKTRSWMRSSEFGGCGTDDLTSCVAGLPDFRIENPEVAEYLLGAHLGLAKRTGIDGFRLDTLKHVDHPFWKEHRARTKRELGESFFLIGELWGGEPQSLNAYFSGDEMDAGFDFSFQGSALAFLMGRGRAIAFDRYLKSREKTLPGYHLSHFLSSHDARGALHQLEGDARLFRLAAILQFTSVGLPMVYYGEEVGRLGGDWPDNRSDMPWGERDILPGAGLPRDETLRKDYARLIAFRKAHPSLWRGVHSPVSAEGDLLVYQQKDAASRDAVVVAINRGAVPATMKLDVPPEWAEGQVYDFWNDEAVTSSNGAIAIDVAPGAARILTSR
jgi:alpha-amylase